MTFDLSMATATSDGGMGWPPEVVHSLRAAIAEGGDSGTAAIVLPDGAVMGMVLLSPGDAGEQLPTVHEERGILGLDPLKDQLTAAHMGDLLNAMAAAHDAARGG